MVELDRQYTGKMSVHLEVEKEKRKKKKKNIDSRRKSKILSQKDCHYT